MEKNRIELYQEFAKYIEYPMVMFEAESGNVLGINAEAEILLGVNPTSIQIQPGRIFTENSFWESLHGRKSMIWHRIRMTADGKELLVSGLIHEMTVEDTIVYTIMFERRADLNIGSVTLERIVNHAGIVAVHMIKDEEEFQIDYISQNINQYGYTRAQLYENQVTLQDIICPEDVDKIYQSVHEAVRKTENDSVMECRILTEQMELIPVRLLLHYGYDDYGNVQDIEILIMDLSDETRRERENSYLHSAIEKMKSVVLVKSYKDGQRKLRYISQNAAILGMNVEALKKGNKLTEDYIHPDDRDSVIDTIYQAVDNGMTDYTQEYRMVRDDGSKVWVENDVTVRRVSDGEAEISFLLTDITERKELEQELRNVNSGDFTGEIACGVNIVEKSEELDKQKNRMETFQEIADAIGDTANFYGVLLDLKGKRLTRPVGPSDDMGLFYDLFERPEFKENFADITQRAKREAIPQSVSFAMDSFSVNMIFAPVIVDSTIMAYWVLASFDSDGKTILSKVAQSQWKLANSVAKCFCADELAEAEIHNRKLIQMQMHREQTERKLLEELIAGLSKNGKASLGELCQKMGVHFNLTDIGIYLEDKKTGDVETYYEWSHTGDGSAFFERMAASSSEYDAIKIHFEKKGNLIVDHNQGEGFLKNLVSRTGKGAIMMVPLHVLGKLRGYVMLSDEDTSRVFDEKVVHFADILSILISRILAFDEKGTKFEVLQESFFEAYNHIRDAVYVKDNRTGDIVFANKAMDKLFGYSLVGMRAGDVLYDQIDQYRAMQGIRKRLIADKKVTKWQCYMKELDQIMNIVEVHLDTLNAADYSLVILKKNKNKDKKKDS